MSSPALTVSETASIPDIVQLMDQRRVKRVPVVRDGVLIGIVTRADILRALVREVSRPLPLPEGDVAVRDAVLAEFAKWPWGRNHMIEVFAKDGVVRLSGVILDERERAAFIAAAENIPGVRMVEDDIVFVEPMSGIAIPPEISGKVRNFI
jgi:CBS domain-containing protein